MCLLLTLNKLQRLWARIDAPFVCAMQTAVLQKLSRWLALEAQRQEEEEQAALEQESQQLSMDQRTAAGRQLFNPKEAFAMVKLLDAWPGTACTGHQQRNTEHCLSRPSMGAMPKALPS